MSVQPLPPLKKPKLEPGLAHPTSGLSSGFATPTRPPPPLVGRPPPPASAAAMPTATPVATTTAATAGSNGALPPPARPVMPQPNGAAVGRPPQRPPPPPSAPAASSGPANGAPNGDAQGGPSAAPPPASSSAATPAPVKRERDILDLTDSLVDLKAEEEASQRSIAARPQAPQRDAKPANLPFLDPLWLKDRMTEIATKEYSLSIEDDSLAYLSLAAEARVRDLVTAMLAAKSHRTTATLNHPPPLYPPAFLDPTSMTESSLPMWSAELTSDPAKWQTTLERVEKEEESRRRRERMAREAEEAREREQRELMAEQVAMLGGSGAAGADGEEEEDGDELDENGKKKKKKKKPTGLPGTPMLMARNMTETQQKKVSNSVALHYAGVAKKSWMMPGGLASTGSPAPRKKKKVDLAAEEAAAAAAASPGGGGGAPSPGPSGSSTPIASTWSKPFISSTTSAPILAPVTHPAALPEALASRPGSPAQGGGSAPSTPAATGAFGVLAGGGNAMGKADATPAPEDGAVTMRDALFVLEREAGHGAGRGSTAKIVARARARAKRTDRGWE